MEEDLSSQKLREEINTKIRPEQERLLMATSTNHTMYLVYKKEKQKKYKEYLSRNGYNNPYC